MPTPTGTWRVFLLKSAGRPRPGGTCNALWRLRQRAPGPRWPASDSLARLEKPVRDGRPSWPRFPGCPLEGAGNPSLNPVGRNTAGNLHPQSYRKDTGKA